MIDVQVILNQLERVRQNGPDKWMASCPAHEDRGPSLSIRLAEDRILLHCFAGCDINAVCSSMGLLVSDLMPRPSKRPYLRTGERTTDGLRAADVIELVDHQAGVVLLLCAEAQRKGGRLSKEKLLLLAKAKGVISEARAAVKPARA